MRLVRWLTIGVLALLGLGVLWGIVFYTGDRAVEADVVEKDCTLTGGFVVVETRFLHLRHTSALDATSCGLVPDGAFVLYHIRSGHTVVYEREGGDCIWDSVPPGCQADRSTLW